MPVTVGYLNEVLAQQLGISPKTGRVHLNQTKGVTASVSPIYNQALTHQLLQARFILVKFDSIPTVFSKALWVNQKQLKQLPFPKIINQFLGQDFINWCKT